jgi:endonuclease/exonuclease/phosphatase family metal-dependent hydrolase
VSSSEPPASKEATLEDDEYDVKARSDEKPAREPRPVRRFARLMGRRALDEAERERRANLTAGVPYLSLVRSPREHGPLREAAPRTIRVATYNVHRWTGLNGRRSPDGARAGFVISELAADVMALQEVLRPFEGEDPLPGIADALRLHLAFVTTRVHRRGELGNAILSRWPITSVFALDLSFSRLERRSAVAVQFLFGDRPLTVVATHLALGDRTRHRQVRSILEHERLQGPVVLLGDLNAWRPSRATRDLEEHWGAQHQEIDWPASFPAARPILALDRVYARGARIESVEAHSSPAARKASDHLPIVAKIHLG